MTLRAAGRTIERGIHMQSVHFALISVVSLSFGLVTPPYGLTLPISSAFAKIDVRDCLKDIFTIVIPSKDPCRRSAGRRIPCDCSGS